MKTPAGKKMGGLVQGVRRFHLGLLLTLLVLAIYLSLFGFPNWLVVEFCKWINTSSQTFAVETDAVRLDPVRGFQMRDVRLYRKGVVGPPVTEAGALTLSLDPRLILEGRSCLRGVLVRNGVFRPEMLVGPAVEKADKAGQPLTVEMELENCHVLDVNVEKMVCRLNADGDGTRLENIVATVSGEGGSGDARGDVSLGRSIVSGRMETRFDPHLVIPALRKWNMAFAETLIHRFEFSKTPRFELDYRFPLDKSEPKVVKGVFSFRDTAYQDIQCLRMDGGFSVEVMPSNLVVAMDHILMVRREGNLQGTFTVDDGKARIDFEAFSSLDPRALSQMLGVLTNGLLDQCTFDGPVQMTARGWAGLGADSLREFRADVAGREMGIKPFKADQITFTLFAKDSACVFTNILASLYGGELRAEASVMLPTSGVSNTLFDIQGQLTDADFKTFARLFAAEEKDYQGELSGWIMLSGEAGNLNSMKGKGRVRVKDGRVFMLPIFGGLSDMLARTIPGLKFVLRQTDAIAEFEIKDGKVHSDDIQIQGDVLSLTGRGDYYLESGRLDYDIQIKFMKDSRRFLDAIVRLITVPITKLLFEFELTGTYANPQWQPFTGTKDLLEKIGLKKKSGGDVEAP